MISPFIDIFKILAWKYLKY